MSFADNVKRQEQQRRQVATWTRAVRQLNWFIRQYLRKSAKSSALAIKPDLFRVDGCLLDRLTIWMEGQTVTVTPLALTDAAAPEGGGRVVIRSTNGVSYSFLWKGESPGLDGQWQIGQTEGDCQLDEVRLGNFTVSFEEQRLELAPLSEGSLDRALDALFGLSGSIARAKAVTPMRIVTASYGDTLQGKQLFYKSEKPVEYGVNAGWSGQKVDGRTPLSS